MYLNNLLFLLLGLLISNGQSASHHDPFLYEHPSGEVNSGNAVSSHKDIVCLIYHRFGDPRYPSTNISTDLFKLQLQYLKDNNFHVITFGQAVDIAFHGGNYEDKTVVITVDDGFTSFKNNALPLLEKFGYKATLFINTNTIGAGDYMTWNDLSDLLKLGYEIGNHSDSHDYFLNQKKDPVNYFKTDVELARKLLHDKLRIDPGIFAYPYGEFDQEFMEAVQSMGFKAAAAQNSGVLCEKSDPFAIPRFPINDDYGNMAMFMEKVNMKALRVGNTDIGNTLYTKNPPVLTLSFDKDPYDLSRLQGFTQGGRPKLTHSSDSLVNVKLVCDRKLSSRRVIYTITIPGKNSKQWYWYSHIWINPDIKE